MTTITKERIELFIKNPLENGLTRGEQMELARIALASLEEEPVAYIFKHPAGKLFWALTDESNKEQPDVIPVYAAAPASVVPDNASEPLAYAYKELTPEIMRNHLAVFERYGIAPNDSSTTIHALRIALDGIERSAAMLHGAEPVSQTYRLPVNTPCQDAPAHIWLQTAGVWPDDGELSELTWCSHNQHHDDTLYVRADLVNGNSPVTPDGWISCSERMPEETGDIIVVSDGIVMSGISYSRRDGFYIAALEYDDDEPIGGVTHWMPLPEPPRLKEL
ncbi:putative phage protein [Escherichia coli]|nr:putative phage protein [Escherichia coli]